MQLVQNTVLELLGLTLPGNGAKPLSPLPTLFVHELDGLRVRPGTPPQAWQSYVGPRRLPSLPISTAKPS